MVGDERSGKPSGLSGSGDFHMDAVRLQRAEDSRLEARSCTRGYGVDQRRSRLREAFVFASGEVRRLARRLGGLLAAACGIKTLESKRGPYSSANALLLRAMVAAEKRQSQSGLIAVAKAFAALGEDKVAAVVLSLVGNDWVEETNDSADIVSAGCWDK
jgi:hypothetical protein